MKTVKALLVMFFLYLPIGVIGYVTNLLVYISSYLVDISNTTHSKLVEIRHGLYVKYIRPWLYENDTSLK